MVLKNSASFARNELCRRLKRQGGCSLAPDVVVREMQFNQVLVERNGFQKILTSYDPNPEEITEMMIYGMVKICKYACRRSCVLFSGNPPEAGL